MHFLSVRGEVSEAINNINLLLIWISTINSTFSIFVSTLPPPRRGALSQIGITANFTLTCYWIRKCFKKVFPIRILKKYVISNPEILILSRLDDWQSHAFDSNLPPISLCWLFCKHSNLLKQFTYLSVCFQLNNNNIFFAFSILKKR